MALAFYKFMILPSFWPLPPCFQPYNILVLLLFFLLAFAFKQCLLSLLSTAPNRPLLAKSIIIVNQKSTLAWKLISTCEKSSLVNYKSMLGRELKSTVRTEIHSMMAFNAVF